MLIEQRARVDDPCRTAPENPGVGSRERQRRRGYRPGAAGCPCGSGARPSEAGPSGPLPGRAGCSWARCRACSPGATLAEARAVTPPAPALARAARRAPAPAGCRRLTRRARLPGARGGRAVSWAVGPGGGARSRASGLEPGRRCPDPAAHARELELAVEAQLADHPGQFGGSGRVATSVTPMPLAPARAVRPTRWT